jgi:hypothetical protein
VSFRAIKEKRDYLGKRKSASWMYMSRLAAQKEWAFLKVRYNRVLFSDDRAQMPPSLGRFYMNINFLSHDQLTKLDTAF